MNTPETPVEPGRNYDSGYRAPKGPGGSGEAYFWDNEAKKGIPVRREARVSIPGPYRDSMGRLRGHPTRDGKRIG